MLAITATNRRWWVLVGTSAGLFAPTPSAIAETAVQIPIALACSSFGKTWVTSASDSGSIEAAPAAIWVLVGIAAVCAVLTWLLVEPKQVSEESPGAAPLAEGHHHRFGGFHL